MNNPIQAKKDYKQFLKDTAYDQSESGWGLLLLVETQYRNREEYITDFLYPEPYRWEEWS